MPTETRPGNWYAIVLGYPATNKVKLDRKLNLHVGDYLSNHSTYTNNILKVIDYDEPNDTVTLDNSYGTRTNNRYCSIFGGGICIHQLSGTATIINAPLVGGHIGVLSHNRNSPMIANIIICDFLYVGNIGTNNIDQTITFGKDCYINKCSCWTIYGWTGGTYTSNLGYININELVVYYAFGNDGTNSGSLYKANIKKLMCTATAGNVVYWSYTNGCDTTPKAGSRGTAIYKNIIRTSTGTMTKTSRSNFPVDTDLPDAWYHKPSSATNVTFRYEDYYVKNGETIQFHIRWLPINTAKASLAITDMVTWWPDIWQLKPIAYSYTEIPSVQSGLQQAQWCQYSIKWFNDTGEDQQIRLWECVTNDTDGGLIRTWRSLGGTL